MSAKGRSSSRLTVEELEDLIGDWPDPLPALARELRRFVIDIIPEAEETIAFNSISYHKANAPYGRIGGNICMIGAKDGVLHLGFIHGAFLPDPDGLLQGDAKAARHIELRSAKDVRRNAFRKLILASVAHDPATQA